MSSSYAVFSYTIDPARGTEVPIGIALWSKEHRYADVRLIEGDERLNSFRHRDHPYVDLVKEKVASWMSQGSLPYYDGHVEPWDNRWWAHVKDLLVHRTRLSEPRPIDLTSPERDLELLYESIVAPHRPEQERAVRVDGEITRCLNDLAGKFISRRAVLGYGDRPVTVTRAYEGRCATVVIEGVNLAADPDASSDLAAGKLLRIRDGHPRPCQMIVGYLTSPGGLNGEKVLVDFLCMRTGARAFDLMKERSEFYRQADESVAEADGQSRRS